MSECFRIESGVRRGCIMSPWLFHAVMKEVKIGMGRKGEWRSGTDFEECRRKVACGEDSCRYHQVPG